MYKVRIEQNIQKKLWKISEPHYSKIKNAILDLANNPRPPGCKKLQDRDAFRIREGDYRIIYEVYDDANLVDIINLGHRKDVYR